MKKLKPSTDETKKPIPKTPLKIIPGDSDILVIAPHGWMGKFMDDEMTAQITFKIQKLLNCCAIVNDSVSKKKLNYRSFAAASKDTEFIKTIEDVVRAGNTTLVLWVHGIKNVNIKKEAKNPKSNFKLNPDKLHALIGYGQGENPQAIPATATEEDKQDRFTAKKETVEKFKDSLTSKGMTTILTRDTAGDYRGRDPDNMNQYFTSEDKKTEFPNVQSIQLEIRKDGFRTKSYVEKTAKIIAEALKETVRSREKGVEVVVVPAEGIIEPDPDEHLVNEAYMRLKQIFSEHFHNAMIDAGNYIIETFYENNPRLAFIKNKAKDRPVSLIKLIKKIAGASDNPTESAPSISWFYNAVNLAAHEAISKEEGLQTFGILGHSHKLELLSVPKVKAIPGNKIEEAITPAFQEKERLAKIAHKQNLSVRAFKTLIKKDQAKVALEKIPGREQLKDEAGFSILKLRKLGNDELLSRLDAVEEIIGGNKVRLKSLNAPLKKMLREIDECQKLLRSSRIVRYNLEVVLTEKGQEFPKNRGKFNDWIDSGNNVNIFKGCENDCHYCYAKPGIGKWCRVSEGEWHLMKLNPNQYDVEPDLHDGMVGFSSTHDIVPDPSENFDATLIMLGKLLRAGNDVLIVSKPYPECIERICQASEFYKDKILFRFTIGAMDDKILSVCEPNAPKYSKRKKSLDIAKKYGFETSVSMEPILDIDNVETIIEDLKPLVTEVIWLGTINHIGKIRATAERTYQRALKTNDKAKQDNVKAFLKVFSEITDKQTPKKLAALYETYKKDPKVMWKGDAMKTIAKFWKETAKADKKKA